MPWAVILFVFLSLCVALSPAKSEQTAKYVCNPFSEDSDLQKAIRAYRSQDWEAAMKLGTECANEGHARAQFIVGQLYAEGLGTRKKDMSLAVFWWEKAANNGSYGAAMNLGVALALGEGTIRDRARAHMWWNIIAGKGVEEAAKYRDKIEKEMSSTEFDEAIGLARKCMDGKLMVGQNFWYGNDC